MLKFNKLIHITIAAVTMEKVTVNSPTPMRCRGVIPELIPVNPLTNGTNRSSYSGTSKISTIYGMDCSDAGGTLKDPEKRRLSIKAPCCTENVCSCARTVLKMIVHANIGMTKMSDLTCSTCATVHSRHGDSFASSWVLMHALSRNLFRHQEE